VKSKLLYAEKKYDQAIDLLRKYQEWSKGTAGKSYASSETMQVDILFQLVKIYNKVGEYDKAWETAVVAHDLADQKWNQEKFDQKHEHVKEVFTKENLRALACSEDPFEQPVFVVGNARSGTSLLEQILSMHPDVGNGGELLATGSLEKSLQSLTDSYHPYPECIFDMTVEDANECSASYREATNWFSIGKKRVTNKAIGLQAQVGFLSLIMPKSRFIMLHRHALDNCLSCFTTNLVHSGHGYTSSLESLGKTWVTRRKMQEYWSEVVETPVMDLHYDKLVVDQENETRRIIEFLELPWNEDCLQFHTSRRVAATISYDQVNQKMYTSSSGRWKNYEKHLGPLIDIVGDYL
jgi:tetratricopeptide (TPR) repeat protein